MPGSARSEIVAADEVSIYHCTSRCVRRAFLCGQDPVTERDYEHRKAWVRERLQQLAAVFAVDVCAYAILSNHLHLILRIRPDLVERWSDEFVVRRWGALQQARSQVAPEPLTDEQVQATLRNPERVAELRARLASLSWFMGQLNEYLARAANAEDEVTGRFWEGRFRCVRLLDEAALLACAVYVDLNPIRAGLAATPEDSRFTSVFDRIHDLRAERAAADSNRHDVSDASRTPPQAVLATPQADWLAPISVTAAGSTTEPSGPESTARLTSRRASDRGLFSLSLEQYLQIVDWTGRAQRADKAGAIPEHLAPLLERLGIEQDCWLRLTSQFTRMFARVAGPARLVLCTAQRADKRWFQGLRNCRMSFRS